MSTTASSAAPPPADTEETEDKPRADILRRFIAGDLAELFVTLATHVTLVLTKRLLPRML